MDNQKTITETKEILRRPWGDYPLTILIINPINLHLVRYIAETKITPNQLSIFSFLLMAVSAGCLSAGTWILQIIAGCLILIAYLIDCLDGDLARYHNLKSPLGAMLDPMLDRYGEFLLILGAALCGWNVTGSINWLIGGIFLAGISQIYFYLVDAMVWKVPENNANTEKRTYKLLDTKLRFGVIEPLMWGLALLSFFGKAYWGIYIFSFMFAAANLVCVYRLIKKSNTIKTDSSEHYGTHTR
jgi:phosphatidylglycerophosphate synthase